MLCSHRTIVRLRAVAHSEDFLASLNAEQRLAVEHDGPEGGPLLVIAGAGSGKTNTLAYRVAHLVRSGADPQRILLLTFSRRAAAEMERRAGQLLHRAFGASMRHAPSALQWAGTFHSVGARLLREYAPRIGLQESFTILDRGDAEDLIAIVRHELGLDTTKRRFPTKATCLAIYSRVVNSEAALAASSRARLSVVRRVGSRAEEALRSLRPREAGAERARLRRPAAVLVVHGRGACAGAGHRRALRSRSRRRVSGHQPAAGRRSCWR